MRMPIQAGDIFHRSASAINRALFGLGLRRGLQVTARITYPIGRATIAIGGHFQDIALMGAKPVGAPSLCIEVKNIGLKEVTVTEVGLTGGEEGPQIPMIDPLLHDNGDWPRRLMPGETVIAHFGSALGAHPVLSKVSRAYALTDEGDRRTGPAAALGLLLAEMASAA